MTRPRRFKQDGPRWRRDRKGAPTKAEVMAEGRCRLYGFTMTVVGTGSMRTWKVCEAKTGAVAGRYKPNSGLCRFASYVPPEAFSAGIEPGDPRRGWKVMPSWEAAIDAIVADYRRHRYGPPKPPNTGG